MDLLTNTIGSIRVGVEDDQDGSRDRLPSSVRSIHAGILLLYKEALRRLSPAGSDEVLLMVKVAPKLNLKTGALEFVGEGKKTVDVQQIRERFSSMSIVTYWQRFNRIEDTPKKHRHALYDAHKRISAVSKGLEKRLSLTP
ncbi:MAG: hypothetical protein WBE76_22745 [Terracidiphilus sp.]